MTRIPRPITNDPAELSPPESRADDAVLLARLREGDEDAFDAIFRAWYPRIVPYVARMLRDREAAEDVAQETMLALWRRRAQLAPDTTLQAYLWQAARNRALNHIRHERIVERAEPYVVAMTSSVPPADSRAVESELERAIADAIASLSPRCRQVFELSRGRGLTYAEIADLLDVSVKAVEAQMGKALRTMRQRLAPWLPGGDTL